jgi:hypothetical protein
VIYVEVPPEIATERWRCNRETAQRAEVRGEDSANVLGHFAPPGEDEPVVRDTLADMPAAWIARHFSHA